MGDIFDKFAEAYEQTGTDFWEDCYGSETDGPVPTPAEETDVFIQQLNCSAECNKPKTFKQRHPKKRALINWRVTYFEDSINK